MDESKKPDEGKQEAQTPNASVTQPTTPPPQQPPAAPNTGGAEDNPQPPQPILVRLVGGNDIKPFEQQSLDISRRTYWIALFGFLAALAAAVFVGVQVFEMTKQTQILASQSEGANAGALMDEMNTRKQLDILQQQAGATKALAELTAKQFTASQQLVESQRASISVSFGRVINPITFHDGSPSIVFSILMQNTGAIKATHVAVRFKAYYSLMGKNIFTEPLQRQRDYCAPDLPPSQDWSWDENGKRINLKGLRDWTVTIEPHTTLERQLNFGMAKPTDAEIIKWPPADVIENNPTLAITDRIFPIVVGCIDYQSGAMPEKHQVGFIFEVQEAYSDAMSSNAARTLVHYGIDLPRERVVITQFFFGQGKKY